MTTSQQPLKERALSQSQVKEIARLLSITWDQFIHDDFINATNKNFNQAGILERVHIISKALAIQLPVDFSKAAQILLSALEVGDPPTSLFGDFIYAPFNNTIALLGCNRKHLETSLETLREMTIYFSSELALRSLWEQFSDQTFKFAEQWICDPREQVRRLASESTRPLLPWAPKVLLPLQPRINLSSRGELRNLNNENCSLSDHGATAGTRLPIQPAHNFPQCLDIRTNFSARQQNRFISPMKQDSSHFRGPRKPLSSMPQIPLPPRNNQMPRPIQEFQNRLPTPNELSQTGIRIFGNGVPRPTLANQSRSQLTPDCNQMLSTAPIPNHGGQRLPMQSPSMLLPKPFVHNQPKAMLSLQNSSINSQYKDSMKELVENWLKSKIFESKEEEKQSELLKVWGIFLGLCLLNDPY